MKRYLVVALVLVLAACATVPPMVQTPSGRPEKVFVGVKLDRVQSAIAEACMNRPSIVEVNTPGQVVCGREASGMDAVLGSMIVGGSYGSQPMFKVRFTLLETQSGIRTQAYQWIESTNAFGRVDQHELNSGEQFNSIQTMLDNVSNGLALTAKPQANH